VKCDAVLLGEWFAATALGLPESTTILQNAGTIPSMIVSHLRRPEYSVAETARQTCTQVQELIFLSMLFTDAVNCLTETLQCLLYMNTYLALLE
jgi:hypothetical protein